ncbi:MAG: CvpA family protein [Firmicutes bacterium]|nr:CvpA family protein [Bacillota bacterium]
MNIVDVLIILIVACGAVIGFKRGFFKELVMTVGFLLVFIVSFIFKNPVAQILSLNLPFFEFGSAVKSAAVLNIIFYQFVAFILVFALAMLLFRILLSISGIIEKILNFTIILGIPSKLLGALVGAVEGYLIAFVVVFVLNQPMLDVGIMSGSKMKDKVLKSTPVLTQIVSNVGNTIEDVSKLMQDKSYEKDVNKFNRDAIDVMLKHKMVKPDYIEKLIEADKIKVPGINKVLDKYKK